MKIIVSVSGQDQRRLAERTEQLVRVRAANARLRPERDASPPPSTQQPSPDRRS